jgi:hypothetical protein
MATAARLRALMLVKGLGLGAAYGLPLGSSGTGPSLTNGAGVSRR